MSWSDGRNDNLMLVTEVNNGQRNDDQSSFRDSRRRRTHDFDLQNEEAGRSIMKIGAR